MCVDTGPESSDRQNISDEVLETAIEECQIIRAHGQHMFLLPSNAGIHPGSFATYMVQKYGTTMTFFGKHFLAHGLLIAQMASQ